LGVVTDLLVFASGYGILTGINLLFYCNCVEIELESMGDH